VSIYHDDAVEALKYAFSSRGYGRWTSSQARNEAYRKAYGGEIPTIDITDSCHVHSDDEQYGPSPIKALLPIQDVYNKGGNQK
jgi:hypothetical protein